MGSNISTADEWVEIAAFQSGSTIAVPRSLSGWTLTIQKETGESVIAKFPQSVSISSGSFLLVSNYTKDASRLNVDPAFTSTAMSLPNTKLQVRLRDAAGILIDEVDDYVGVPFAGENPSGGTKASMERIDLRASGTVAANWRTATTSRGFDDGPAILGTPGFPNGSMVISSSSFSSDSSESSASSSSLSSVPSAPFSPSTSSHSSIPLQPLPKLIINELLSDSVGSDDGEWIEIKNTGSGAANLSGMTLRTGTTAYRIRPGRALTVEPGAFVVIPKTISAFSLVNNGTTVRLESGSTVFDTFIYGFAPEGVSSGRNEAGAIVPYCIPTPGFENTSIPPDPQIIVQSGKLVGPSPVTLNLMTQMGSGTLAGAKCRYDFGDGFTSDSCNPSSHTIRTSGNYTITLQLTDYCSTTVTRTLTGSVFQTASFSQKTNPGALTCTPNTFSGVLLNELMPNPSGDEEDGEWIELKNVHDKEVNLCGWFIDDEQGGSKPYSLSEYRIPSRSLLLLPRTDSKIALNNDHDMARLIAPIPGGGTGVSMSLFFDNAEEDEAFALDGSGAWIWSPYPTPAEENRFIEPTNVFKSSPISISAAFPNPKGDDTWDEWIELKNTAGWPIWLNGWVIRNAQGKELDLTGTVLSKVSTKRILLQRLKYTLANSHDTLYLIDDQNIVRSILPWEDAKEDVSQEAYVAEEKPVSAIVRQVIDADTIVVQRKGHDGGEVEELSLLGVQFPYYDVKNKYSVSALLLNKKVELQFSTNSGVYIQVDGTDLAQKLLTTGKAYADRLTDHSKRQEYISYEQLARSVRVGLWHDPDALLAIDARIADEERWKEVHEKGLTVKADVKDGLVASGTVVRITPSEASQVYISINSGAYAPFTGSIVLTSNQTVKMFAQAEFTHDTLEPVRSDVVTRTYIVQGEPQSREIQVSEVYPSPDTKKGEQEWIELYNPTINDVSLAGWLLDDAGSGSSLPWRMPIDTVIPAQGYLLFHKDVTKLSLNNSNDDVRLLAPDGSLIDAFSYGTVKTGRAVARNSETGEVCLTDKPTPQSLNTCFIQNKSSTRKSSLKSGSKSKSSSSKKISKAEQARINYERTASGIYAGLSAKVSGTSNLSFQSIETSKKVGITAGITILCAIAVYGVWIVIKRGKGT